VQELVIITARPREDVYAEARTIDGDPARPLEWQEQALCAQTDPESFFPEKGGSTREAKRVCDACPVRVQCLDYALENQERFGIWGGLSERERRRMEKRAV
jgi:WhiB family redox-sensing transcriptional regulator